MSSKSSSNSSLNNSTYDPLKRTSNITRALSRIRSAIVSRNVEIQSASVSTSFPSTQSVSVVQTPVRCSSTSVLDRPILSVSASQSLISTSAPTLTNTELLLVDQRATVSEYYHVLVTPQPRASDQLYISSTAVLYYLLKSFHFYL